jgi:hypothetical protein
MTPGTTQDGDTYYCPQCEERIPTTELEPCLGGKQCPHCPDNPWETTSWDGAETNSPTWDELKTNLRNPEEHEPSFPAFFLTTLIAAAPGLWGVHWSLTTTTGVFVPVVALVVSLLWLTMLFHVTMKQANEHFETPQKTRT